MDSVLTSIFGAPALDPADTASSQSLFSAQYPDPAKTLNPLEDPLTRMASRAPDPRDWASRVKYTEPEAPNVISFGGRSTDPYVLDTDPDGLRAAKYGRDNNLPYTTDTIGSLNIIGGRAVSYDKLMQSPEGRELLDIALKNRHGKKRDFWESVLDVSLNDVPFMTLVGTQAGSLSSAVRVADTYKKLQNGEAITEEEGIVATLAFQKSKRSGDGTTGAMIGDIIRQAPGFMTEFLVTDGIGGLFRTGVAKATEGGIHAAMTRSSKIITRELVEQSAKTLAEKGVEVTARSLKGNTDWIVGQVMKNTMLDNPMYKGLGLGTLTDMATKRTEYEIGKYLARTGGGALSNWAHSTGQWFTGHISRGLMDFGAWGSEEATLAWSAHTTAGRALADAIGAFTLEAGTKGALMWAPNQFIARPLVASVATDDGRAVSRSQLDLMQTALLTGNTQLMEDAQSISMAQDLLEYVSENAGRGFGPLLRSAGMGIDRGLARLGYRGTPLVEPARSLIRPVGAATLSEDAGVSIGSKIREWIGKTLGTREDFTRRAMADKIGTVTRALNLTDERQIGLVRSALTNRTATGLTDELLAKIGSVASDGRIIRGAEADRILDKFVTDAVKNAYARATEDMAYKSYARFAVANYMDKFGVSPQGVYDLWRRMGYDGIMGEMFEERYSDVAKGLFGWDERREDEKGFFKNIGRAIRNMYPEKGFQQLVAEAVGFAMPLVTRGMTMRLAAKVGGDSVLVDTKRRLEALREISRTDEVFEMPRGEYVKMAAAFEQMDQERIAQFTEALADAKTRGASESEIARIQTNLDNATRIATRRRERHSKFAQSLGELAEGNLEDMITVPYLSDQLLASDDYNKIPALTAEQASAVLHGRVAMVDFAPELARRLHEFQSSFDGESKGYFRWIARKLIGFTGGIVTGDFSNMFSNPVQWHARDYGLTKDLCNLLKNGYHEEYLRQSDRLTRESLERSRTGEVGAYAVPREEVLAATDAAFAERARNIMAAHVQAKQFRTFTQSRFRDQAVIHVASRLGDDAGGPMTPTVVEEADGTRKTYLVRYDDEGNVVEGSRVTLDEFAAEHEDAVEAARSALTVATVDLLARNTKRSLYARTNLLTLADVPRGSEMLPLAIYETAASLVGEENLVYRQRIDGDIPMEDRMRGESVARVNMAVVARVASADSPDKVDGRLMESLAFQLGVNFDGTKEGLAERNRKIFRIARMATAAYNGSDVYYTASTAKLDDHDSRRNLGNQFSLKASLRDGKYVVTTGVDPETNEPVNLSADSLEELDAKLVDLGFHRAPPSIVFTHARIIEFDSLTTAIRQLGFVDEYVRRCEAVESEGHPLFRRSDASANKHGYVYATEEEAMAQLQKELSVAALWDGAAGVVVSGATLPAGVSDDDVRRTWNTVWNPKTGYMAIGEKLLADHHVVSETAVSRYAGEFSPYGGRRYVTQISALRGRETGSIYVPVSGLDDPSLTNSILNARLLDGYVRHPVLLRDALNGVLGDFVGDVDDVVVAALALDEVKKDKQLYDNLVALRRTILADADRTVVGPDGGYVVQKGKGVSPESFTRLAANFALFRAGTVGDRGFSRAMATIAPTVWRLPSFLPFMNLVDLTLGGNGFLSEMIANGANKEEALGDQLGVRRLLSEIDGDPQAFRKAFARCVRGMSYKEFLQGVMDNLRVLAKSGVRSASEDATRNGEAVSATVSAARSLYNAPADASLGERSVDEIEKELASVTQTRNDLEERLRTTTEQLKTKTATVEELRKQVAELQRRAVELSGARENVPAEARTRYDNLNADVKANLAEIERLKKEVNAIEAGGDASPRIPATSRAEAANAVAAASAALGISEDDEGLDAEVNNDLTVGLPSVESVNTLPSVFDGTTSPVTMRHGAEEGVTRELTPAQAKLAVNVVVRALVSSDAVVSESDAIAMAKKLFPGFSDEDVEGFREQYRALDEIYARDGRSLEDAGSVSGDLWAEEIDDEEATSSDNFNEKSVAEFESKELGDFLALAQKASPETGRNFQAVITNIRELNRWQRQFINARLSEYDAEGRTKAAIDFVHDFLSPRGNVAGKTMAERLSLFEHTLRSFDTPEGMSALHRHIARLLSGGRNGRTLSHKGAFLFSYLSSLKANDRNRFAVLVSNSLNTSPVTQDSGRFTLRNRADYKVSEGIVVDGFSDLIGKSRSEVAKIAADIRKTFAGGVKLARARSHIETIRKNGMEIALKLHEVFGAESPLFSALTSPRMFRHLALAYEHGSRGTRDTIAALAKSMSFDSSELTRVPGATGVEFVDIILSCLDALAAAGNTAVSREEISTLFTGAFTTGNVLLGLTYRSVNSSRVSSPLMTLMSMFDASLPETVMRAEVDFNRSNKVSSVAIASRGSIPLGNRFLNKAFSKVCSKVFTREEVESWNPGKTYEEVMRECMSDMTWPDRYRTPIFAKSLTRDLTAAEVLATCATTYQNRKANGTWYVPMYAGDHSSSVMVQLPYAVDPRADSYVHAANKVCKWFGLDLLGADAKRSMVSSLECEGVSMIGYKGDVDGKPQFGENRMFVVGSLQDGFTNEELKGNTLAHGYGAEMLKRMAKDPKSSAIKAHFVNAEGEDLACVKSLSLSTGDGTYGKFAEGTTLRTLMDWLEKQIADEFSTGILTDLDSYKIGIASRIQVFGADGKPVSLLEFVFSHFKAKASEVAGLSIEGDAVDAEFGDVVLADGSTRKLTEMLPGVRIQAVDGLSGPAIALSFTENEMIGYTVANVSHDSKEPEVAARTPRNHEVDAWTMATALMRLDASDCNQRLLSEVTELIADWGVVASAVVSDANYRRALEAASSSIAELLRHGEAEGGQNIKEELVRVINAEFRKTLNMPLNAEDSVLVSCGAIRDRNGVVHDHTKSEMQRAMHAGSYTFTADEAEFYGVKRRVAICNVNVSNAGFRYGWFLDEDAFTGNEEWAKKYFDNTDGRTGDERTLLALENLFTDLRRMESAGDRDGFRTLRRRIATMFVDHHGNRLIDRVNGAGKNIGEPMAYTVSFDDLFRINAAGESVFDRSAVQIGGDRVKLDADGEGAGKRIFLAGSMFGLPRTPSYNGSMWLQVVRAGLPVTEVEHENGAYTVGYDAYVSPDPGTLDILGCDHDGDKTKLYFLHSDAGRVFEQELPRGQFPILSGFGIAASVRKEFRNRCAALGMFARKRIDEDGAVREIRPDDPKTYDGEFLAVSDLARKRVSNAFVRRLFEMARALPLFDETGVVPPSDVRHPFNGLAVSRNTKAFPTNNKGVFTSDERIPEGVLRTRAGKPKANIGDVVVAAKITDGASDASLCRANVVSVMKDLHFAWASGLFFSDGTTERLFNDRTRSPLAWFNSTYHEDGISNATFDDMKEQICSRLRWRPGMIDVLFTDILRNRQSDGSRGPLPQTDAEFQRILLAYSIEANAKESARWWMDRASDQTDASGFVAEAAAVFGIAKGGFSYITRDSLVKWLGIEYSSGRWIPSANANRIVKELEKAGGSVDDLLAASSRGGKNVIAGYLMYLNGVSDAKLPEAIAEFARWNRVYRQLSDAREFSQSINYLNIDAGNDIASGRRDRVRDDFAKVVEKLEREPARSNVTKIGEYDLLPAMKRMNLTAMVVYEIGDGLMTVATRGALASTRHVANLDTLAREGNSATLVAKALSLDVIPASGRTRNALEGNAQQIPYILSALMNLPTLESSKFNGFDGLYDKLLGGIARGVNGHRTGAKDDNALRGHRGEWILDLRRGIETMFDLMYRLATTSTEHRVRNNVFSYFREAEDKAFSKGYGDAGVGLYRILPAFRANSESSIERIRDLVEDVISGRSFSGERNVAKGLRDENVRTFSLGVKSLTAWMSGLDGVAGQAVKKECEIALAAIKRLASEVGVPEDEMEITPAMMFGQLLPLYSVITSRTVGAPTSTSASLLAYLPLRFYRALSSGQVSNDARRSRAVDAVIPLNLGPRSSARKARIEGKKGKLEEVTNATVESAAKGLEAILDLDTTEVPADYLSSARAVVRGGDDEALDWRENPDYRNTCDIFAVGGIFTDLMNAVLGNSEAASESAAPYDDTGVVAVLDGLEDPGEPEAKVVTKPEVARFARALGALCGSWATVKYVGGDSFQLRGRLRGDVGSGHQVVITVSMGDIDVAGDEAAVEALAGNRAFAASFCAATDYTYTAADGRKLRLDVEHFMSLPFDVRKAFVRRYQIGAASANPIAWTVNAEGVATLVGAIRLNGAANGTKLYHEYFHSMTRMFDALGVFGEDDVAALREKFGAPPKGAKGWLFDEERAAEAFRKWVVDNTAPEGSRESGRVTTVFQRIYDFLKGLLKSLQNMIGYRGENAEEALFKMAVHGIAQTTAATRTERVDAANARKPYEPGNAQIVSAVDAIREYTRDRLLAGASAPANYEEATVREILEGSEESEIADVLKKINGKSAKSRAAARKKVDAAFARRLSGTVAANLAQNVTNPDAIDTREIENLIDSSIDVPQDLVDAASKKAAEVVELLGSDTFRPKDVREALDSLVSIRAAMAEAAGFSYSEGLEASPEEPSVNFSVIPGETEYADAEIRAAVDAGTVLRDRPVDSADTSLMSRIGNILMKSIEDGLFDGEKLKTDLSDVLRAFGNPRPSDVLEHRATVVKALRTVVQTVAPELSKKLKRKDFEDSLVFETLLRVYQRIESAASIRQGDRFATGANKTTDARLYDVSGWLMSRRLSSPATIATDAVNRVKDLLAKSGGAGATELVAIVGELESVAKTVSDPTGLANYRRGLAFDAIGDAITNLRAGVEPADGSKDPFDSEGFQKDLKPVDEPAPGPSSVHARRLAVCWRDRDVQEALKLALRTLYQLQAMAKFMGETDTVAASAADIEFANDMAKRGYARHVGDGEWYASQAMSTSMLVDNRNLVEYYDQSYFIGANPEAWLANLVRKTFGNAAIGEAMQAEHREYGALKSEILRLANFYSYLLGDNCEPGDRLLKLTERTGEFSMEFGEVVHKVGGRVLKFDNYNNVRTNVRMTEDDIRWVDLYKKMLFAYMKRQSALVTGVDRISFNSRMSTDPRDYTVEKITDLEAAMHRGGRVMNPFEEALFRLTWQFPTEVLAGRINLWDNFVNAACRAMKAANEMSADERVRNNNFDFNTEVLRRLSNEGVLVAKEIHGGSPAYDGRPRLSSGALLINVDSVNETFLSSGVYKKLTSREGGRTAEQLDRDSIRDSYLAFWRKFSSFVKAHPWLTEGDGKFFNTLDTCMPFFQGSGIFMYAANRRDRREKRSYSANLTKYEESFRRTVNGEHGSELVRAVDDPVMLAFLNDLYRTGKSTADLRQAIVNGTYERGDARGTDLKLSGDCTYGDVAAAIYLKLLERADLEASGARAPKAPGVDSGDDIIRMYEEARTGETGGVAGATGLDDIQMYRLHGVLPANYQLGHAMNVLVDGVTNAMMQRGTLVSMLTASTADADGAPMYYARPDMLAVEASGLPDVFWAELARWWGEYNGIAYDEARSGVANAQRMYDAVQKHVFDNGGKNLMNRGNGQAVHSYKTLGRGESDLTSVTDWLAHDDADYGDESSALNAMVKGEAMGYLKQFVQASRVLGFGGPKVRATLHRALSWSKTLSVSFSMFFPIATKWESPVGAVGAMATMGSNGIGIGRARVNMSKFAREHSEAFNAVQKLFGGKGWITKNFLGFQDILEMMDSNDPFLAELVSWAEALGVKITDRFVNPVEHSRGIVEEDIKWLNKIADQFGKAFATNFRKTTRFLFSRSSERAFSYALNATKLATVAQLAMKLRREAESRGKAFDPIRDLRKYAGYINAEIGGIDPLKYAWATPLHRGIMNSLMFSWEWTRGAWEAGGGNVIEDFVLGGHSATREERNFFLGRWIRMFSAVMIGVPAMIQMMSWAMAKAIMLGFGGDDDDDREILKYINSSSPFLWDNETKIGLTAADITPLLKVIGSRKVDWLPGVDGGTTVADLKRRHPVLAGWIPAYTGEDPANRKTGGRRLYLHFGKQGWEFFRWFDSPGQQFMSKLSMPTQRLLEGVFGVNLGYIDHPLEWAEKGAMERWLDPSFDGATFNLLKAFMPFSVSGMTTFGDAGLIPVVGPVQYGASYTQLVEDATKALDKFVKNDRTFYRYGYRHPGTRKRWMRDLLSAVIADAKKNGVQPKDIDKIVSKAVSNISNGLYNRLWDALPRDPNESFDAARINEIAREINRLGSKIEDVRAAFKARIESRGWEGRLTDKQREMYKVIISNALRDPFRDTDREKEFENINAGRFDY